MTTHLDEPTLAERLGFAAHDRVAVIHSDDIGMCHAANVGAFEALLEGHATCGSIMVPCPWFREAAERARVHPDLDLGVHLTLNSEWPHYRWGPVAGRSAVPSLLDDQGFLPRTSLEVVQKARVEEVEIELRAQLQMALDAGLEVTHLDSHMGTCFFPPLIPVYKKLAIEFQLPAFASHTDEATLEAAGLAGAGPILRELVAVMGAEGFPIFDNVDANSLSFAPGDGRAHNEKRIAGLKPGLNYLICHPALDGDELRSVTPDSAHQRDFERRFYAGAEGAEVLAQHGVKTLGMRPLRDLLRSDRGS